MKPISFAVVGLGRIGRTHCHHFSALKGLYQLAAVCDRDQERAKELANLFRCTPHTELRDCLREPDLELVIIATRSLDHAAHAEEVLAAGKTVLLEKPIGVTEKDEALLHRLDRQYPGKLFFGHNHRFEPAFQNTLEILRGGSLGEPHWIKLCKHHPFMRRDDWQMRLDCGGGQLSVWGPHLLDQGLQLLGSPVAEVVSVLKRILTPGDGDDHVWILLHGENGRTVEIEISNAVALESPYLTIYGDRGSLRYGQAQKSIELKYLEPTFQWSRADASVETPRVGESVSAEDSLPWINEERRVIPEGDMWSQVEDSMAKHLYKALREGVRFPVKNAEALEVLRVTSLVKRQNPQFAWL